jgi:hypothetical protein
MACQPKLKLGTFRIRIRNANPNISIRIFLNLGRIRQLCKNCCLKPKMYPIKLTPWSRVLLDKFNISSANEEILLVLRKLKVRCRFQTSPPPPPPHSSLTKSFSHTCYMPCAHFLSEQYLVKITNSEAPHYAVC